MERVRVEKGKVKLYTNPKVYSSSCISKTCRLFSKSFKVSRKKVGGYVEVTLKPKFRLKGKKLDIWGYEFFNYLLSTLKEMKTSEI